MGVVHVAALKGECRLSWVVAHSSLSELVAGSQRGSAAVRICQAKCQAMQVHESNAELFGNSVSSGKEGICWRKPRRNRRRAPQGV